jgi:hypothetical protein
MHIDVDVDLDLEYNVDVDIDTDVCVYIYIDWTFNSSKCFFYMTHPSDIGRSDITNE